MRLYTLIICVFTVTLCFVYPKDSFGKNDFSIDYSYYQSSDEEYEKLIAEYCLRHYGTNTHRLINPKIIVVHYTATDSLKQTLVSFLGASLRGRGDILGGGDANVGTHFVIDLDGTIYAIRPLSVITRHAVGYNYTAIGIENVGLSSESLTDAQVKSTVNLIIRLKEMFPSIEYLIGHHEYLYKRKPHYSLYLSKDNSYTPQGKLDPGRRFMKRVRLALEFQGVIFLD